MKYETHTMANGLKIILAPHEAAASVTVMVMSGTGSRYESKQESGIAHFLEHMVFKGAQQHKNAKVIAEAIDGVGGVFNAFTGKDHTAYYAKVDARHFQTACNVISDIFLNPTFPKAEIERERGTILEEINMYEDMPMRDIFHQIESLFFGAQHPLGRPILGSKKNIKNFTRKEFVAYYKRNYSAENSVVCIAGAFSKTKVLKEVRQTFRDMSVGKPNECVPYEHLQEKSRVLLKYKKTDQTHIALAFPGYPVGHPDEATATVLAALLGGGMSSRLFTQVRERRGLAYYVRAEHDEYQDTGMFTITAGVTNESVHEAITVIYQELKKLMKRTPVEMELRKTKEYIKGTTALGLDTTDAEAAYLGYTTIVRHTMPNMDSFRKKIDAVTAQDVQRVARAMFIATHINLAVIGPHRDTQSFLDLLV